MAVYAYQVEGLIARLRSRATEPGVAMRWKEDFMGAADMLEDIQRYGISAAAPAPVDPNAPKTLRPNTPGMDHGPDDINPDTKKPYGEATPGSADRSQSHESTPGAGLAYQSQSNVDPRTGQPLDRRDQVVDGAKIDPATGRPKSAGVVNTTQSAKPTQPDPDYTPPAHTPPDHTPPKKRV